MEYIDATPTWAGILPLLLRALSTGDKVAHEAAVGELRRMAEAADKWNDHVATLED